MRFDTSSKQIKLKSSIMFKTITLSILTLFLNSYAVFGQESFSDENITVTSEVLKYEDPSNDKFYNYYNFTVKNLSSENQKIELIINYDQNGVQRSSQSRDESPVLELEPGETISGDIQNKSVLTLFKSFLPGNSGKKASDSSIEITSIEVNYL